MVQAVRCISSGIRRMPAHHAHQHRPQTIYNIDPSLGALVHPPTRPPQRARRSGKGAAGGAGSYGRRPGDAIQPGRTGADGFRPGGSGALGGPSMGGRGGPATYRIPGSLVAGLGRHTDPLEGETLLRVLKMLGWLNWSISGYRRTQWFEDVLLRRDGGHLQVLAGGGIAKEDQERILRAIV